MLRLRAGGIALADAKSPWRCDADFVPPNGLQAPSVRAFSVMKSGDAGGVGAVMERRRRGARWCSLLLMASIDSITKGWENNSRGSPSTPTNQSHTNQSRKRGLSFAF
jgi:hypothetical protein